VGLGAPGHIATRCLGLVGLPDPRLEVPPFFGRDVSLPPCYGILVTLKLGEEPCVLTLTILLQSGKLGMSEICESGSGTALVNPPEIYDETWFGAMSASGRPFEEWRSFLGLW
jgi:hypothetical protein